MVITITIITMCMGIMSREEKSREGIRMKEDIINRTIITMDMGIIQDIKHKNSPLAVSLVVLVVVWLVLAVVLLVWFAVWPVVEPVLNVVEWILRLWQLR